MTAVCPVCGQRLPGGARVCNVCGEPICETDSAHSVPQALAPTAGLAQDIDAPAPARGGRDGSTSALAWLPVQLRLLLLVSLVIVGLALAATYAALRSPPQRWPDGAAFGVARMSAYPALRWQAALTQIAPDLRCPRAASQDNPSLDACSVTASATVQDVVVVAVQRSQQAELVGLRRADGAVKWRKQAPAGSTYDCLVTDGRLWCLTVPLIYQVIQKDPPVAGVAHDFTISRQRSAAYRGAALTRLEPSTGQVLHTSAAPGSTQSVAFAGVGIGGFYVLGHGSSAAGTVVRFSDRGEAQWSHPVTLVQPPSSVSVLRGSLATPEVYELGGRVLVSLSEVAGRQVVFRLTDGAPVRSDPGHIVSVLGGTVVTQVGSGALRIGQYEVQENAVAVLAADDRSAEEPVLTTRFTDSGLDRSIGAGVAGFVARSPSDPIGDRHLMQAQDQPVAYCAGVVLTLANGGVLAGYDPASSARRWVGSVLDDTDLQVRCVGSQVVFATGYSATAFSVHNGAQTWSLTYPLGSILTGRGYGDPGDGLVAGPSNDNVLPTGTTSVSYLR